MEQKFKKGDIVSHPSIEKELTVIRYLDNLTEGVLDHLFSDAYKNEEYKEYTIVLCKWDINNQKKLEQFEQVTLTLIKRNDN